MIRPLLALAVLIAPAGALAAERHVGIGSFDRLRISGPFRVEVATGRSPAATITGDPRTIDDVELRTDGSSLSLRMRPAVMGEPARRGDAGPIVVTLATPALGSVMVGGGASVTVGPMKADRIAASLAGSGSLDIASADTAELDATLIGPGSLAVRGGRAGKTRLLVSGAGGIDAGGLDSGDVLIHADALGETKARARYTADVTNGGQGSVTVTGNPKCIVRGVPAGIVACGH